MIIQNGYSTLLSFGAAGGGAISALMRIMSITPPGWDGGGPIDTTSMANNALRTRISKALITMTEMPFTVQYDPILVISLIPFINLNQQISILFPDDSIVTFWGWFNDWKPGENKVDELPVAACSVVPSNQDNNLVEQLPTYLAP
jgi:hypothetical protein